MKITIKIKRQKTTPMKRSSNLFACGLCCLISLNVASCGAQSPEAQNTDPATKTLKLTGDLIERNQFLESISKESFSIRVDFHGDGWDEDLKSETSEIVREMVGKKLKIDSESNREVVLFLELSVFGEMCLYQVQFGVVDALITPSGDNFRTLVYNRSTAGAYPITMVYERMIDRISFVVDALFGEMNVTDRNDN